MSEHKFYRGRALDRELRTLYEDKGKLPDMTRLEHKYHRRTTRVMLAVIVFLLVLVAASWSGFLLFGKTGGADTEVELTFTGPEVTVSGIPQTVKLRYKNRDRNPIGLARLSLRAPEGLFIKETQPATSEEGRLTWTLGTLTARETGEITLTVIPYGSAGSTLTLQALLGYKPANFNAEFQSVANYDLAIRESAIEATFNGPQKASAGEELIFAVNFQNRTDEIFENVQAVLVPLASFSLESSEPKLEAGVWKLGTLEPGKEGKIDFKGVLTSSANGPTNFIVRFEILRDKKAYALGETTITVDVKGGNLTAELLLNNTTDVRWVRLGDELGFRLKLTNTSLTPLNDATAAVALNSALLDLTSLKAEEGALEGAFVRFPKEGRLALEAGKVQEFTFSVKVIPAASPTVSPTVDAQAEVTLGEARIKSNPIKVFVVSDLTVVAEGRYFGSENQPIGGGPLPPKVGEATTYELRWRIRNTFHDLANVAVTATLPSGVNWTARIRADTGLGTISFNAATREVRWSIPRLPVTTQEASVSFEILAIPAESQRGGLMSLLGVTRAEAQDVITGVTFSTDAPSVSSNLEADPLGRGKGVVQ